MGRDDILPNNCNTSFYIVFQKRRKRKHFCLEVELNIYLSISVRNDQKKNRTRFIVDISIWFCRMGIYVDRWCVTFFLSCIVSSIIMGISKWEDRVKYEDSDVYEKMSIYMVVERTKIWREIINTELWHEVRCIW